MERKSTRKMKGGEREMEMEEERKRDAENSTETGSLPLLLFKKMRFDG